MLTNYEMSMLFNDEQIRVRMAEGRCLICGVKRTSNPPICRLQPLDIPPGTAVLSPHLWPEGEHNEHKHDF